MRGVLVAVLAAAVAGGVARADEKEDFDKAWKEAQKIVERMVKDEPAATKANYEKLREDGDQLARGKFDGYRKARLWDKADGVQTVATELAGYGFKEFVSAKACSEAMGESLFRKAMAKRNPNATAADLVAFAQIWGRADPVMREACGDAIVTNDFNIAGQLPEYKAFVKSITK